MNLPFEIYNSNLIIHPSQKIEKLLNYGFSINWKIIRTKENKYGSLVIFKPYDGYYKIDNKRQPHYISMFAEAKIVSVTQNNPIQMDKLLKQIFEVEIHNTYIPVITLAFYASLGIVHLSVPSSNIDSCLSAEFKRMLGLNSTEIGNKIKRYNLLLQQLLSNNKIASIITNYTNRLSLRHKGSIDLALIVLKLAIIKYSQIKYNTDKLVYSLRQYKDLYPFIEYNIENIIEFLCFKRDSIFSKQGLGTLEKTVEISIQTKLRLCEPFYSDSENNSINYFYDSAILIVDALLASLLNRLSIDEHFNVIGLIYEIDRSSAFSYHIDGITELENGNSNSYNSARIMAITYFSTFAIIQGSIDKHRQKSCSFTQVEEKNHALASTSYLSYILSKTYYANFIYNFVKKFKVKRSSDIAANLIRPIIFMTIIKFRNINMLDISNINISKSLKSIKNKLDEYQDDYPLLWHNIQPLTPDEIKQNITEEMATNDIKQGQTETVVKSQVSFC
jgi:hypothetical protein